MFYNHSNQPPLVRNGLTIRPLRDIDSPEKEIEIWAHMPMIRLISDQIGSWDLVEIGNSKAQPFLKSDAEVEYLDDTLTWTIIFQSQRFLDECKQCAREHGHVTMPFVLKWAAVNLGGPGVSLAKLKINNHSVSYFCGAKNLAKLMEHLKTIRI